MNLSNMKRYVILLLLASVFSLAIIRTNSVGNVPYCLYSAGCHMGMKPTGKITTRTYGYPLAYKKVQIFNPTNSDQSKPNYAGYAETKIENLSFSLPSVIVNIVFWFALLHFLSGFIRPKSQPKLIGRETDGQPVAK